MTIVAISHDPKSLVIKLVFTMTVAILLLQLQTPANAQAKGGRGGADIGATGYLDNKNSILATPNDTRYRKPVEEIENCSLFDISAPLIVRPFEDANSNKNGNGIASTDCIEIVVQ